MLEEGAFFVEFLEDWKGDGMKVKKGTQGRVTTQHTTQDGYGRRMIFYRIYLLKTGKVAKLVNETYIERIQPPESATRPFVTCPPPKKKI